VHGGRTIAGALTAARRVGPHPPPRCPLGVGPIRMAALAFPLRRRPARGVLLGRLGQLPQSQHALQLGEDVGHRLVPANSTTDADSTVAQTTTDDGVTATNAVGSSGDSNVASIGTA
jgi:hypothetical protein